MRHPIVILCVLSALGLIPLRSAPIDSLINASDLLQIKIPSAPAISPDGNQVAYTVRAIEPRPDALDIYVYRTQIWLTALDGRGGYRALTQGNSSANAPAWSPGGDRLAYLQTVSGSALARVWILPLADGAPYAVTPAMPGLSAPRWSPDGTRLLFTSSVTYDAIRAKTPTLPPPWPLERPRLPEPPAPPTIPAAASAVPAKTTANPAAKKPAVPAPIKISPDPDGTLPERRAWLLANETENNPSVTWRLDFNEDHDTSSAPGATHVYSVSASADATPVDLTPGYASYDEPVWSRDGQTIFCTGPADLMQHPDRVLARSLYTLTPDGMSLKLLSTPDGYLTTSPQPSPDGKTLAWIAQPNKNPGDLTYGIACVATFTLADGKTKILTEKLDRAAANPRWSVDGKYIYFTAPSNGGIPLYRVPAAGGKTERLTTLDMGVSDFDVAKDDLALVLTKPANPGELYRASLSGRSQRILTSHNNDWLRDKQLSPLERRKLKRPDGTEIEYWLMKSPYIEGGFRYPLLLEIHGGPGAMWGPGDPAMWHELQFFAARGYGVVFCNPRGSDGYGRAFLHATYQDWGPGPGADVLAVATDAAKENWIDPERQVIAGGSYGGYLTAWLISQDQRFKAAIAARGVYDLTTFLGEGNAWELVPWQFGGYPWQPETRKRLDAQSPLTHVETITTPLLIKQDDADLRVGTAQSELLYRSLKILGRPVEYVRYPGATHDLSRTGDPAQHIDRLVRFAEFFERFIGNPAQPIPLPPLPAGKNQQLAPINTNK